MQGYLGIKRVCMRGRKETREREERKKKDSTNLEMVLAVISPNLHIEKRKYN